MPIRMTGLVSNMDTDSIIQSLMSVQRLKQTKIENKITKLEWKQEKWKALNSKIYSFYKDTVSKMRLQGSYMTKNATSSDESVAKVTASTSAAVGTHTLEVSSLASAQYLTGSKIVDKDSKAVTGSTLLTNLNISTGSKITVGIGTTTKDIAIDDTTTVDSLVSSLKSAGLKASFDTTQNRFFISSDSGLANAFSLTSTNGSLAKLGLGEISTIGGDLTGNADATLKKASDAVYKYNGASFTSSSNSISVNGLNLTLTGTTAASEQITLNVTDDTDAVYDMVKDFVSKYNSLLKEMNTDYYAESATAYDPLTDDEKESMSEDEITKWEDKIKGALLRKDDSLNTMINLFRDKTSATVSLNSKTYALSSFGIATSSDWTEKGLLHIDGDEDDSLTSAKTNKLKEALESDPDTVMSVISELAGNLYTAMTKEMTSTTRRSSLTVYDDKEMKTTLNDYNDELDEMEDRLQDMEDRYYSQFSAMETAMAKLNSQSSYLSSLMGTSS